MTGKHSPSNNHPDYVPSIFPKKHADLISAVKPKSMVDVERAERCVQQNFNVCTKFVE